MSNTDLNKNIPPDTDHDQETCEIDDCQVCLRLTIPQHVDNHGTKLEDEAGTGEYEVMGG